MSFRRVMVLLVEAEYMKYHHYSVEDFLADERFVRWARNPDKDTDHFWGAFLRDHPEKEREIVAAKRIVYGVRFPAKEGQESFNDAQLEVFLGEVIDAASKDLDNETRSIDLYRIWSGFDWLVRSAAVLIFGFMTAMAFWYLSDAGTVTEQSAIHRTLTKSTEAGQKLALHLEDGTLVRLNASSSLAYPDHFDSLRTVYLTGEAYFEVARDQGRPFEVITRGLKTTVLGTKFAIDEDPSAGKIDVAVLEGKVSVEDSTPDREKGPVILEPSQALSYSMETRSFTEKPYEFKSIFGWKDGLLVFTNDGFDDVVRKLERWYGVKVVAQRTFSPEKDFSGEYQDEVLKDVLVGISYTFGFEFELQGKTVIIK